MGIEKSLISRTRFKVILLHVYLSVFASLLLFVLFRRKDFVQKLYQREASSNISMGKRLIMKRIVLWKIKEN